MRSLAGRDAELVCTGSVEEATRALREMRDRDLDTLALVGGDGTCGFTLTLLRQVYGEAPLPAVALLRGGTMNTIAKGIGVPTRAPVRALEALIHARRGGGALVRREVPTMDVDGRVGFLFGTGVGRTFLEEYYRRGDPHPDLGTAVRTLGAIAWSVAVRGATARRLVTPERYALEIDGQPQPARSYVTIMAGTVSEVGLGFAPFYRAASHAHGFHLIAVHGPAPRLLRRLPRAHRGRPLGDDCALDARAERVRIDAEGAPVRYFLDGDLYEAPGILELGTGPRLQLVWAPPS